MYIYVIYIPHINMYMYISVEIYRSPHKHVYACIYLSLEDSIASAMDKASWHEILPILKHIQMKSNKNQTINIFK